MGRRGGENGGRKAQHQRGDREKPGRGPCWAVWPEITGSTCPRERQETIDTPFGKARWCRLSSDGPILRHRGSHFIREGPLRQKRQGSVDLHREVSLVHDVGHVCIDCGRFHWEAFQRSTRWVGISHGDVRRLCIASMQVPGHHWRSNPSRQARSCAATTYVENRKTRGTRERGREGVPIFGGTNGR